VKTVDELLQRIDLQVMSKNVNFSNSLKVLQI
jgi:hypothetical protein